MPARLAQVTTFGTMLLCAALSRAAPRQTSPPQTTAKTILSGQVLDAAGKSASGAVVILNAGRGMPPLRMSADANGLFTFRNLSAGIYAVHAEDAGLRSGDVEFDFAEGTARKVILSLDPAKASTTLSPNAQGMEFSDTPNFTVAGVTDWTAVGGHGSDATLRTSEDLARQTLALKASSTSPKAVDNAVNTNVEKQLQNALSAAPQSYTANRDMGSYYLHTAQYGKAVPLLKTASKVNGAKAEDEYAVALACRGASDLPEAWKHLQHALVQQDRADFHHLAAELEEQLGDPLSSVKEAARATQLKPTEENYFIWGSELLLHRAVWQAVEVFGDGAKAHPASARLKTAWGSALFAGAHYDEAAQRLCEASDLDPADREPYLFMGKAELASPLPLPGVEQRLARFVQMQPNLPEANYFYAMALSRRSSEPDLQRVEALLTRTIELDPHNAEAYLQLGILAFAQRKYPDAIRFYQRAIAAKPNQGEAHYRLGVAYDRIGEAGKAKLELQLHDEIEKAEAEAVEQKRREVKQFLVVLQGASPSAKR